MPLIRGYRPEDISRNIHEEILRGKRPDVAKAIAYRIARQAALRAGDLKRYEQLRPKAKPVAAAKRKRKKRKRR